MATTETKSGIFRRLDQLNEFDREPVSEKNLLGGGYFAGSFAGEHVAATEFVIGALFVTWGASTYDVLVGLLWGNLLAVLSWALICAPIGVQTRLTLYWYLRKIGGPTVMVVYNLLNAVLYCILAGCMITVAASAVRIPFGIEPQTGWLPTDPWFVVVVLCVGAVVVTLAILGFKRFAQFASLCSPWMLLMFILGAVVVIREVGSFDSMQSLWELADRKIWTGKAPDPANQLGFWHIVCFAWICNLAMHVGLSDMALFRYAKRSWYGMFSAFGMFLGHYLAWICAGVMGAGAAIMLNTPLDQLDAGQVAFTALGWVGALAVVIAGWTTSNPTLYRAGLALQVVTPNWPRWLVTLVAGAVTTLIACFPFVFRELLNFVGIYGLLLMPVGAIVVVEHWIFPRIGFTRFWASRKNLPLNVPAAAAWGISLVVALICWWTGLLHLFFLAGPVWILTAVLYIAFAAFAGAREELPELPEESPALLPPLVTTRVRRGDAKAVPPKSAYGAGFLALACLVLSVAFAYLSFIYAFARADFQGHLVWLTLVYFISGTVWMRSRARVKAAQAARAATQVDVDPADLLVDEPGPLTEETLDQPAEKAGDEPPEEPDDQPADESGESEQPQ